MPGPRLRPATYRVLTLAALVSLAIIVVTGALVRLTDSGLGCRDWPRCNAQKVIDVSSSHAAIEQLNRLFTGVVAVAVIVAVAGSLLRVPRRRDLTWLSLSLVVGVIGQAVVGGIVVLTHLNPVAVQQHFLLSMAILAAALVLYRRASLDEGERWERAVPVPVARAVWGVAGLATVAFLTGTVVTGTGPHSGQRHGEPVHRFDFAITSVARVHSGAVIATMAAALWLAWRLRGTADHHRLEQPLGTVLLLGLVQGTIGYVQYFSGVPVVLVALHVTAATFLWLAVVNLVIATRRVIRPGARAAIATAAGAADGTGPGSGEGAERPADLVELRHGLLDDLAHRPD